MGLNFSNGSGSEYLRWMASRSEWVMGTENGPEIVELKKAVFDVATLRTGWAAMAPETIPEFEWDPSITKAAPRPKTPGEWKRAFECKVFAENALGGVRVWSSNSTGACMGSLTCMISIWRRPMTTMAWCRWWSSLAANMPKLARGRRQFLN